MEADQYLNHWIKNQVWTHLQWPKHQTRLRRCSELVEGSRFLDVGCAFGHSTRIMAGFRQGIWAGLDFSVRAVNHANTLFPDGRWIYAQTSKHLASLGPQWDSIVCSEVIEHVENPIEFVTAIMALARLRAVFTTPTIRVKDPGHLRIYNAESLALLFLPWRHEILREEPFFYIVVDKEQAHVA